MTETEYFMRRLAARLASVMIKCRKEKKMSNGLEKLYDSFTGRRGSTYEKNRFQGCMSFTASACTDGSCPIALKEQYPDQMDGAPNDCRHCYYRTGLCKDCIFEKSIYCPKITERRTK